MRKQPLHTPRRQENLPTHRGGTGKTGYRRRPITNSTPYFYFRLLLYASTFYAYPLLLLHSFEKLLRWLGEGAATFKSANGKTGERNWGTRGKSGNNVIHHHSLCARLPFFPFPSLSIHFVSPISPFPTRPPWGPRLLFLHSIPGPRPTRSPPRDYIIFLPLLRKKNRAREMNTDQFS